MNNQKEKNFMNNKETQTMTFEYLLTDYKSLSMQAMRAFRGGTIEEPFAETFLDAMLPNLYDYVETRANPDELLNYGHRVSRYTNVGYHNYEYEISNDSAECYFNLQDRYGKHWVVGFLLNIYEDRQEAIEQRVAQEEQGNGHLYTHPFNPDDWYEYRYETKKMKQISFFERDPTIMSSGYVIDVNEPLEVTIDKFFDLKEKK